MKSETKKRRIISFTKTKMIIIGLVAIIVVLVAIYVTDLYKGAQTDYKTTKLRFENIGELATQVAYATEVGSIKDSRDIFGIQIPFTQSSYIYSYDFVIKVGFDFRKIDWKEEGTVVKVQMPTPKVFSNEIKLDSLKVYNEEESIFTNIAHETVNESSSDMQKDAEKSVVENGIFDMAKKNAETIIKSFLSNVYAFDQQKNPEDKVYTIEFEYPKEENSEKNS